MVEVILEGLGARGLLEDILAERCLGHRECPTTGLEEHGAVGRMEKKEE